MKKNPVIFFSISEYDNLGVGYIASVLEEAGFSTRIIDFRDYKPQLLNTVKNLDPLVIGFSIIFLNYIELFSKFIKDLREIGINCHFTAGGHYASLRHEELFSAIPELDSIVMFDGEYPMLELAICLRKGENWKKIRNLAFKENGKIAANSLRLPETDLDRFPFPLRTQIKEYAFNRKFTVIIAGRGCTHNCSFCNTREFYRRSKGPLKRIRKPGTVVNEMKILSDEKDCSIFIFHDDDFPVRSIEQPHWITEFCNELEKARLNKKILWKINCRPDDVEEESFAMMKKNGLFLAFLGLEDGTNHGLKRLNKQMSVESNLKSIQILKSLEIGFDYGFMLFQPETTFSSLTENLEFLRLVCSDGYTPASFLKLVPVYETRIEKELKKSGRLKYSNGIEDYDFNEEPLGDYYNCIRTSFKEWLEFPDGLLNISKWARNYCAVYKHYYSHLPEGEMFSRKITEIISESNVFLLDNMKELAAIFNSGQYKKNENSLRNYKKNIKAKHRHFKNEIFSTMANLLSLVEVS